MLDRTQIYDTLTAKMSELFDLESEQLSLETHLFQDLDLDSIDAIDLAVQLQELTGKKVPEQSLRDVRTIGDVVELVVSLQAA